LPDVSPGRRYVAGVGFFDPTAYADLAVAPVNAE
jgi:hypothetical protein